MKEKISIIVPCYNEEKYIERCINSILSQTLNNIELIIMTMEVRIIHTRYVKTMKLNFQIK